MSITLTSEQEQFIQQMLATGRYQKPEEVIQVALHLLEKRDQAYQQWVTETSEKVDAAAASLDRGEGLDGEEVVSRILEKFRQVRKTQG